MASVKPQTQTVGKADYIETTLRTLQESGLVGNSEVAKLSGSLGSRLLRLHEKNESVPEPLICATEVGTIEIEWWQSSHCFTLEIEMSSMKSYWHLSHLETGSWEEGRVDLLTAQDWEDLAAQLIAIFN